ncbi:MAG: hypothetical protein JWQ06_2490 [Mucilaginibacter sp.]|nr:hypothetical protein [Mucilaginibacter sp.]
MSVQNALKLIKILRNEKLYEISTFRTLTDLAELSQKNGLPCSADELKTAFETDWKMRWMKQ